MINRVHACAAAVLLCGAVGIVGPVSAATQHKTHHAATVKHKGVRMSNEARLNAREHAVTARLNRQALTDGQHADAGTTATADVSSSDDDFMQQAFL